MKPELTSRLIRICAWCKRHMGYTPCDSRFDGQETHGMCDECAQVELKKMKTVKPLPPRTCLQAIRVFDRR